MFHMPMSSPMMTTMLGWVGVCACAVVNAVAASNKPPAIALQVL